MNGLIGQNIGYSLSKQIYNLNKIEYDIYDIDEQTARDLILSLNENEFLNITTPYKKLAFDLCEIKDEVAKTTGNINLIVKKDDLLKGYNTDYYGLEELFKFEKIQGRNFAVLGDGAVSGTTVEFLKQRGAEKIKVFSRKNNDYLNNEKYNDFDCLINATTVSPDILDKFENLKLVIDLKYSPLNSNLLILAKEKNIKVKNGISMLLRQAYENIYTVFDKKIDINIIKLELIKKNYNIVLVGMPGSGKTVIGKKLAEKLDMRFLDTDTLIEEKADNKKVMDIIKNDGKKVFRALEKNQIKSLEFTKGSIISTGGGSVEEKDNRKILRKNSIVFYIDRDISKLDTENRPLSTNLNAIFDKRDKLYRLVSDEIVFNDEVEDTVNQIIQKVIL